jgi:ABC-type uncharacterized transport system ATPase subunit
MGALNPPHSASEDRKVRIVCISDTHNDDCTGSLPDGDVLIHSGDMTDFGTMEELQAAYDWISALPHKVKIIVAGMMPSLPFLSAPVLSR